MKMKTAFARFAALFAIGLLAACADADAPPAPDEGNVDPLAAEDGPQTELLSDDCVNDAGCSQGYMCVNPPFGDNWCAQLCYNLGGGENTCPSGYKCTKPFPYTGRNRCVPN